jgi:glycosyltransferase involved in cell wall biosynthesis
MRLLMISGDQQVAAGERGPFHALLEEFRGHFDGIDVLVLGGSRGAGAREVEPFEGVRLHVGPAERFGRVGWLARKGTKLVAAYGHGLVVSHDYGLCHNGKAAARIAAATGLGWVSELHHVPGHPIAASWREKLEFRMARRFVRWATPRVVAFRVVNATEMPQLLGEWEVPEEKIAVLSSLYLDLEVFRPAQQAVEVEQDIVFVGRLVANKGLDAILGALRVLRDAGRPQRVLFVGRGPLEGWLDKELKRVGLERYARRIDWVDGPEELAAIYRASRVCLCASTSEGGPRVPLEAMACGTPVVSTRVGVMSDVLADGTAGELCDFSGASLARALALLLADEPKRAAMGVRGVELAAAYERSVQIRRYAEGLRALAQEGR